MARFLPIVYLVVTITACAAPVIRTPVQEVEKIPLVDVHSHFSTASSPDDFLKASQAVGFSRMVLMGSELAARLAQQEPNRFIASYRPAGLGNEESRKMTKYGTNLDSVKRTSAEVEQALRSGLYRGLGEIPTYHRGHVEQIPPDSPLILRLLDLAGSAGLPINIHCADSGWQEMDRALRANRKTVVVWAHAGSHLSPIVIKGFLRDHSNLFFDLASKHPPWTFRRSFSQHILNGGLLAKDWRELFESFPDRFLVGSDLGVDARATPLSFAPDVGYFFRTMLSQITPTAARKIAYENAEIIYKLKLVSKNHGSS